MASPVVEATNTSSEAIGVKNHTVALPAGIQADELLLVWAVVDDAEAITFPGGWTKFEVTGYGDLRMALAYRKADGGEGASITCTTANNRLSAYISYRISGALDPGIQAPEASNNVFDSDDSPDSANLTPTGGAKDYLWLAMNANHGVVTTVAPAGYGNLLSIDETGVGLGSSERALNAAAEDSGVMTLAGASGWVAETIAVHPSAAAVGIASQRLKIGAGR